VNNTPGVPQLVSTPIQLKVLKSINFPAHGGTDLKEEIA
jgi:hypothetical protein